MRGRVWMAESCVKNMNDTNVAAGELRNSVDARDCDAIAKNAAALATLFESIGEFRTKRKTDVRLGWRRPEGRRPSISRRPRKSERRRRDAAARTLQSIYKQCHDAHRERLPDGSSEIT